MSLRGYAKSRDMALSTLQHHISTGKLLKIDGKIDPDYADVVLRERIDHKQSERGRGQRLMHGRSTLPLSQPTGDGVAADPDDARGIEHWRLQRERHAAKKLELEVFEIERRLVDADSVHQVQFEVARQLRDSVMAIPSRVADILAAENRATEVERILSKELRQVLSDIALDADDTAAEVDDGADDGADEFPQPSPPDGAERM